MLPDKEIPPQKSIVHSPSTTVTGYLESFYKVSLLTHGQIQGIFYDIVWLHKHKFYKLSDYLKNKLINVGGYWREPQGNNSGDFCGTFYPIFRFGIKNKIYFLEGYINTKTSKYSMEEFSYKL